MEALLIEPTKNSPSIHFDPVTGKFSISGKSISENTPKFYQPVFDWLENYGKEAAKETRLSVQLDYFNTSSAKVLLDLFKRFEKLANTEVEIDWFYNEDDEDMQEAGENYQSISKVKFTIKSIQ